MSRTREISQSRTPLRVLIVAPSLDILGGQAVQAARLVERLREVPSLQVGFLPINPRGRGVLRRLQAIKYVRTCVTSLLYVLSLLLEVRKYDVIHIFSASYFSFVLAPTPAILIGKLFRKKLLLNYHSGEAEDHLRRWPSAVAILRIVDELVVPSNYLVRIFSKFNLRATAIANLVDLENFHFRERHPRQAAFLSNRNFEKHYGVDQVLRAFALIQARLPAARLTIAGDGKERRALEKLAAELGLRNTKFVGQVSPAEVARLYDDADLFLNASEIDNQPLSILEAFATGLPVVTTDAGGIPEMVTNEVTGFVVKRGDFKAIAEGALKIVANPQLAKTLTRNAVAECRKFSWEVVGAEWTTLYLRLSSTRLPSKVPSRFQKLQRMSFAEVRERAVQAFASFTERHGWSRNTRVPSDIAFLKSLTVEAETGTDLFRAFHERSQKTFFASFRNRETTIAGFRRRWPDAEQEIIGEADRIICGRFDLLGFRDLGFGDPINWHLEPVSGKTAPVIHWSQLNYLDAELVGDKKIIWELNRHQYFIKLGQAYWLTGDEKYAAAFVAQIESWMDQNPPKLGINWASSLEIAFRSIAWLWALNFFAGSSSLNAATRLRCLKFLQLHGRHLETYLSTYFSPNTHLTGEALGLYYLGSLLPEFEEAARWRNLGRKILLEQMARQVRADGVYFEQSSYYHRYTTDFFTHFLVLSRLNGDELPSEILGALQFLLDHLMYITRPDGTTPLFGDDDGGRLLFLDRRPANDFRAALTNGAVLFERGDYKHVARELAEETFWMFGPEAITQFDQLDATEPPDDCKDFPAGGFYVLRDGWTADANYLLFDCGPHGTDNCGHAHADALAIDVASRGQSLLVDSGTYTYTGSKGSRDWFRSSAAHNTLTIDSDSSSIPSGPFSWTSIAKCESLGWINERRFAFVEGRHDGYERLPEPATHSRAILFLKNDYWILRDCVSSVGPHDLQLHFHFAPEMSPEIEFSWPKVINGKKSGFELFTCGANGVWVREMVPFSHCYGNRVSAPVFTFSARSDGPAELLTVLLPSAAKNGTVEIREVEAIGGRAVEVTTESYCDVILLRDELKPAIETVNFISDFKWTWARFHRHLPETPEALVELVVMKGKRLTINGNDTFKSTREIEYAVATRAGECFRLETPDGAIDLALPVCDLEKLFFQTQQIEV